MSIVEFIRAVLDTVELAYIDVTKTVLVSVVTSAVDCPATPAPPLPPPLPD